jgi:hypothetical protein
MSMQYPVTTRLGRFQTRNNRIVVIESSESLTEVISGEKVTRRIWNGQLLKADGRTFDTAGQWEDCGAYRNQRGVAMTLDLVILVSADPVPVAASVAPAPAAAMLPPPPPTQLACPFCQAKLKQAHGGF